MLWFSNFSIHQNPQEGVLNHRFTGCTSRCLCSVGLGGTWECAFLTSSQETLMLVVLGPLFKTHWSTGTTLCILHKNWQFLRVFNVTYIPLYNNWVLIVINKTINSVECIKNNVWNTSHSFQLLLVVQKIVSLATVLLYQPIIMQRS